MHVASHQDDDVGGGDRGKQFAVLCFFHVCAVELFHQSYGIRIDLPNFRPCGKAVKNIACEQLSETFGDLAAAGIVYANESDFRFAVAARGSGKAAVVLYIHSRSFHIRSLISFSICSTESILPVATTFPSMTRAGVIITP